MDGPASVSRTGAIGAGPSTAPADGRATSFLQRASLRRRLNYLRRRRELSLRDLGGFVFECKRQHQDQPGLLAEKLAALGAIDDECEQLERALGERQEIAVLREPGISSCANCGALHDSGAHFCPQCGTNVDLGARKRTTAAR